MLFESKLDHATNVDTSDLAAKTTLLLWKLKLTNSSLSKSDVGKLKTVPLDCN